MQILSHVKGIECIMAAVEAVQNTWTAFNVQISIVFS